MAGCGTIIRPVRDRLASRCRKPNVPRGFYHHPVPKCPSCREHSNPVLRNFLLRLKSFAWFNKDASHTGCFFCHNVSPCQCYRHHRPREKVGVLCGTHQAGVPDRHHAFHPRSAVNLSWTICLGNSCVEVAAVQGKVFRDVKQCRLSLRLTTQPFSSSRRRLRPLSSPTFRPATMCRCLKLSSTQMSWQVKQPLW